MAEQFDGNVDIFRDAAHTMRSIRLQGTSGEATLGGGGVTGGLNMVNQTGDTNIRLNAEAGTFLLGGHGTNGEVHIVQSNVGNRDFDKTAFYLNADQTKLYFGGQGSGADISLYSSEAEEVRDPDSSNIRLTAENAHLRMGGNGIDGDITLFTANETKIQDPEAAAIHLDAEDAHLWMGAMGHGNGGEITLFSGKLVESDGRDRNKGTVHINGNGGSIYAGGNGTGGLLALNSGREDSLLGSSHSQILLNAKNSTFWMGGNGDSGDIVIFAKETPLRGMRNGRKASIHLEGENSHAWLGGNESSGAITLFPSGVTESVMRDTRFANIHLDGNGGNIWLGGDQADGDIVIFPKGTPVASMRDPNMASIHLNGDQGDIILRNADCAEDFTMDEHEGNIFEPGTVMVIGAEGKLSHCDREYDKRVAGVISGAGEYRPGLVLDRNNDGDGKIRKPVALMGKVYCKVDASFGAIELGDLLTTSNNQGFARKASDPTQAFGTVLGKALAPHSEGEGMIPILVTLQ